MMRKALIAIFICAAALILPGQARAALLYTGAGNQVAYVGRSFIVEWFLDTQGRSVNTLDLVLTYSPDLLEAVDAGPANSALDLWVRPPSFDNSAGEIRMTGGISSGAASNKLAVFRATFRPKAAGQAKISMKTDSRVLLADGQGTAVPLSFNEVNFTVNAAEAMPASISSESHPDQDAWYREHTAILKVSPKPGEAYSYSFSSNLEVFPDPNPDDVTSAITFKDLPDGIYYFKLNSKAAGASNAWQEAGVYRVQIDSTPPREFKPVVAKDPSIFDGHAFVSFNTVDSVSGVQYYEVKTSPFSGWQRTDGTYYKLPGIVLGDTIEVRSVDAAGNEQVSRIEVDQTVAKSAFSGWFSWAIIVVSALLAAWLVWRYFRLLKKYKINAK
jgi:hypothetical protein